MAESDGDIPGVPVLVFKPGFEVIWLRAGWTGHVIDTASLLVTKTQPGQDIGDQAQALPTGSVLTPESRLV